MEKITKNITNLDHINKTNELIDSANSQEQTLTNLAKVASSGEYKDLSGKPTKISQFTNDKGYITSSANITGNSATATKLQSARTINGVIFDGSKNISIKADPNEHTHFYEEIGEGSYSNNTAYLNTINTLYIDTSRACRTAFMPNEAIIAEYSENGGNTWTRINEDLRGLFSMNRSEYVYVGGKTTTKTVTDQLQTRITVIPIDRYAMVHKFYCWFCSCGHTTVVDIERSTIGEKEVFKKIRTDVPVGGWTGPNTINFPSGTFGGSSNQEANNYSYRFTFKIKEVYSACPDYLPYVTDLRLYGDSCWSYSNDKMLNDCIYSWDNEQNVKFPNNIEAKIFAGDLTGNAATAAKLQSPVNINGVAFDGSENITISADPNAHTHTISGVNGLQATLDNKLGKAEKAQSAKNADTVNGHTVNSNVPSNAKFTDTTYGLASGTTNGLMSSSDKNKIDNLAKVASSGRYYDLSGRPSSLPANGGRADSSDKTLILNVEDSRDTNEMPDDFYCGLQADFKYNSTNNLDDGGTYNGVVTLKKWSDSSGGKVHQLSFTDNNNLWHRSGLTDSWEEWTRIADFKDIPSNVSQLTNDAGYITRSSSITGNAATTTKLQTGRTINGVTFDGTKNITITAQPTAHTHTVGQVSGLSTVATTGNYQDLLNKPTIPTNTNQLTNGSNFVTKPELNANLPKRYVVEASEYHDTAGGYDFYSSYEYYNDKYLKQVFNISNNMHCREAKILLAKPVDTSSSSYTQWSAYACFSNGSTDDISVSIADSTHIHVRGTGNIASFSIRLVAQGV